MTDFFIFAPFAFLGIGLVYDCFVAFALPRDNPTQTITRRVRELSKAYPSIPFMFGLWVGLLAGHFWGNF